MNVELRDAGPSDSVDVPCVVGLRCHVGLTTPETSQKLFDDMDLQPAVQVHLGAHVVEVGEP